MVKKTLRDRKAIWSRWEKVTSKSVFQAPVKQSFLSLQSKWHLIWFCRWSFLISWMIPRHPFRPAFHKRLAISWGKSLGELSRTTRHAHTCAQIDMPHNGILKWNHLEGACEKLSLGTFSHHVTRRLRWQAVARQCVHFHLEKWDSLSRTESGNQFSSRKCSKISQDLCDFLLLFRRSSFTKSHLWNSFRSDLWTCECVWGSRDECDWIKLHSVR